MDPLQRASEILGAPIVDRHPHNGQAVHGHRNGFSVTYIVALGWASIQVYLPSPIADVVLEIAHVNGRAARFSKAFRVEGAPSDVVLACLTPELRAWLLANKPAYFNLVDGAYLNIQIGIDADVANVIDVGVAFVARLATLVHDIALARDRPDPAGYRDGVHTNRALVAREEVLALRRAQRARDRLISWAISITVAVIGAVIYWLL